MKKLSQINEGMFKASIQRSNSATFKKEDNVHIIKYDGKTYGIKDFFDKADEFNNDRDPDDYWEFYAFDEPKSGHLVNDVVFGYDKYDIDGEYDIIVLASFIDFSDKNMIDDITDRSFEGLDPNQYPEIKNVVYKYTKKLFDENRRNDIAHYSAYDIWPSDMCDEQSPYVIVIIYGNAIEDVIIDENDEFYGKNGDAILVTYPDFDNWYETLEPDLRQAFEKYGWKESSTWEPDITGCPSNTNYICFCKEK